MKVGIKKWQAVFLASTAAVLLLAGCAGGGSVKIAKQDLVAIKKIAIDPEISQPDMPFIQGADNLKAFLFGGVGAAIEQKEAGQVFKEYMVRNNIDVTRIVADGFRKIIVDDKLFAIDNSSNVKLKLTVNTYGFGKSSAFAGVERRPLINITAALVANGSTVIWKKTEYITNLSDLTTTYTFDQLAGNPQLTTKSLEQATGIVARQILADLKP